MTPADATALAEQARAAVAGELGVAVGQVTVVSVQAVEWRDTSLGCPESGMTYAQMITPGYLIKLSASGKPFEYHADRRGSILTCESPQAPARVAN